MGIIVRKVSACVLIALLVVQISIPAVASSPSSIVIDQHQSSVSSDQVVQFSATVTDSSGSTLSNPINWSSDYGTIDSNGLFTPGLVGTTVITAESGGINTTTSIQVTAGHPFAIQSLFNRTNVSIDEIIDLNATLIDRAGNSLPGELTYRCENGHIDHQNSTWEPSEIDNDNENYLF